MSGLKGGSWEVCPVDGAEPRGRKVISDQVIHVSGPGEDWESGAEPNEVRQREKR